MAIIRRKQPILKGKLIRRHKRFLADIELPDGDTLTAMCANTGSMKTCNEPGRPVILSDSQNEKRKYLYTWELIKMGGSWVNVNTGIPNGVVETFVERGVIENLAGYPFIRREVKYGRDGRSRIDLLLTEQAPPKKRKKDPEPEAHCEPSGAPDCYVEVKNTSMIAGAHSVFPDSVTTRGQKHLDELTHLVKNEGKRAAMVYFCGRTDTEAFRPADEIDPEYGRLFRKAMDAGVEMIPLQVKFTPKRIELVKKLPVDV